MEMNEQVERLAPNLRSFLPSLPEDRRNLYTAGLLIGAAGLATAGDLTGATQNLPNVWVLDDMVEITATSGRHPMVGFLGAAAAGSLIKNPFSKLKAAFATVGAAIADLSAEAGQAMSPWAIPEFADFWTSRNLPETGKDALFAAAGLGLYLLNQRRQGR